MTTMIHPTLDTLKTRLEALIGPENFLIVEDEDYPNAVEVRGAGGAQLENPQLEIVARAYPWGWETSAGWGVPITREAK